MAAKEQLLLAPRGHQLDMLRDLAMSLAVLHELGINRTVTLISDEEHETTALRLTRLHPGDVAAIRATLAKEAPGVIIEEGLIYTHLWMSVPVPATS